MKKGAIRGILTAFVLMEVLILLFEKVFEIDALPAHQLAGLSIIVWIISCSFGFSVFFICNRLAKKKFKINKAQAKCLRASIFIWK